MSDLKLYEIAEHIEAAMMAEELDEDNLNSLIISLEEKVGAVMAVSDNINAFIDLCKAEEKRIAEKRKFAENRVAELKKYVMNSMELMGMAKIPVGTKTAVIQKNPPKLIIDDKDLLPRKFVEIVQSEKVDNAAIKSALSAGDVVPGAHIEQGLSLRFK